MKSLTAFALVVLACVPARAQYGGMGGLGAVPGGQPKSLEVEFLEMEQEADKAALKEALVFQARQGMRPATGTEADKKRYVEEAESLREFISKKKDAITARASEITKARAGKPAPVGPPVQTDRKAAIEKAENAQVEVQLIQAKLGLLQEPLSKAIQELAEAEVAAAGDESRRDKAATARKEYDRIKALYVEESKRLRLEQQAGGVMGGMVGGFR